MTLLIAPADLASLYAGQPLLLALDTVGDAAALALPGLALWLATPDGAALRLHRPGHAPGLATLPVPLPPAQVLGLVAPDAASAAPLLAWWSAAGPDLPPLIEAATAAAALPELARLAVAALAAQASTAAVLHRALAAARQDAEETRQGMVALLRHTTRSTPPPAPTLLLSLLPSPMGHAVAAVAGRLAAGQMLGVALEGLAAVALHVHEAQVSPAARLRLRLYGAESGRVHGAWLVPGEALVPGWLTLDLPSPVGPVWETACLDIAAELEAGDALALALDEKLTGRERAAMVPGQPDGERALALRLWTAPFGRRFVVAPHWDAEALDLPVAPHGVPVRLPAQLWNAARCLAGAVDRVALGAEAPRLVASLATGREVAILLPAVPVNGLDLLQAEVMVGRGDPALLEAALWLQPENAVVAAVDDLSLEAPGARWSGWRGPPPEGGPLLLPLALPLQGPRSLAVVLVLRHAGPPGSLPLRVEWPDLLGFHAACPLPPASPLTPRPAPALAPIRAIAPPRRDFTAGPLRSLAEAPAAPGGGPSVETVRLQEYYVTADGAYRHLDIWLEGVCEKALSWPRLRFKLALRGEGPALEFRIRADWPAAFSTWPGTQADEWGPYLLVREADLSGPFLAALPTARDRAMLATLVRLLPGVVGQAVREAPAAAADGALWLRQARQLAAALREPAG